MSALGGAQPCVMIVDDQEDVRDTLREVIELGGCEVVTAADGVEALQLLERMRPCLIVLDLLMPVMTGQEVLLELRKTPELAKLPVVVSTSAPHLAPSGVPILPKPIDISKLWGWMRRTCDCAAQRDPRAARSSG